MIQRVLSESDWTQRMLPDDLRALTPLLYAHGTPYGAFRLDMSKRLAIDQDAVAACLTAPLRSTLAHILVCFLALARWCTLEMWMRAKGPGTRARST
jgi:hypothetical protein